MRHWYLTAACAAGLAAAALGGAPVQAADDGPIAISVVRESEPGAEVREGDTVAYVITVENTGAETLEDLQVSHLLPAGFALREAEPAPDLVNAGPGWTVSLRPGERVALADTVEAGTGDQIEQGRLVVVEQSQAPASGEGTAFTTTVCVAAADGGPILACASDHAALLHPESSISPWWWAAAAAAVAAAAGAVFLLVRVRKARRQGG